MTRRPSPSTSRPGWLAGRGLRLAIAVALVVVLVGAATVWYIFLRPAGPPPIGPGAPVIPAGAVSSASAMVLASPSP